MAPFVVIAPAVKTHGTIRIFFEYYNSKGGNGSSNVWKETKAASKFSLSYWHAVFFIFSTTCIFGTLRKCPRLHFCLIRSNVRQVWRCFMRQAYLIAVLTKRRERENQWEHHNEFLRCFLLIKPLLGKMSLKQCTRAHNFSLLRVCLSHLLFSLPPFLPLSLFSKHWVLSI